MTTYAYNYEIGTTLVGVTNLATLATPVGYPKSTFTPYSEVIILDDNSTRGIGAPIATWHWDVLPQTQRDFLRTFCAGSSAVVFIRTRTKDSAMSYAYYQAKMVWPTQSEETLATRRLDFTIEFRELVIP